MIQIRYRVTVSFVEKEDKPLFTAMSSWANTMPIQWGMIVYRHPFMESTMSCIALVENLAQARDVHHLIEKMVLVNGGHIIPEEEEDSDD